jgi:hypothetical protein
MNYEIVWKGFEQGTACNMFKAWNAIKMVGEGQDLRDSESHLSKLNNINMRTILQKLNSSLD